MDTITVLAIALVAMAAIAFIFILLYTRSTITQLSPDQCVTNTGTYGVTPETSGTTTSTITGVTLLQATVQCDQDPNCTAFSYNYEGQVMNILDITKPFTFSPSYDLYRSRTSKSPLPHS